MVYEVFLYDLMLNIRSETLETHKTQKEAETAVANLRKQGKAAYYSSKGLLGRKPRAPQVYGL